jgi:leader peptidase (prepilin peptidase) / N-methyltransferase
MINGHIGRNRWFIAVTLVTAATFVAVALRFGISRQLPAFWYFSAVAVPLAFIDAREQRLPDLLTLPSYPAVLLLLGIAALAMPGGAARFGHAVAGMAVAVAFFGLLLLISPGGLGLGDVKLGGVAGACLGWLGARAFLAGILGGWLLAAVTGIGLIAAGRATRKTALPFGPFLIAATLAVILLPPLAH